MNTMIEIERENALSLAAFFRDRAAKMRAVGVVLVSDYENYRDRLAFYDTTAAEIEAKWA